MYYQLIAEYSVKRFKIGQCVTDLRQYKYLLKADVVFNVFMLLQARPGRSIPGCL